ncbi:MAG TPA: HAMP domain-containing protein, partial [Paracoccaceae bacterium]|nr:HAMP domain-containing protein [Paracoccaceae bacterium]
MQQGILNSGLGWVAHLRSQRRFRSFATFSIVALGPLLALATFVVFGNITEANDTRLLRVIGLLDLVYVLLVAALVARQIAKILAARRSRSAGSRLHMRLTAVFTIIALIPTILVAVFATITLNFGLEGWFSDRVRNVVGTSLTAARAYESEHKETLEADARLLANYLNVQKRRIPLLSTGDLRELLNRGQLQMQRALPEAYVINGDAELVARGERSYLFDFEAPTQEEIERARAGEVVLIEDWQNYEFRALVVMEQFFDRFLYVTRDVDGGVLSLLDETQETVLLYQQLENERGRLLFEFALIYLGFALIVILAAVWLGMWFAERLAKPVGRLVGAAERVGEGDLNVRVPEEDGDDEIAVLGRSFNHMTEQVKGQRDALIDAHETTEKRRRLFDSVLGAVTAGVLGLDKTGRVELINTSAAKMLGVDPATSVGIALDDVVPEFADLFKRLQNPNSVVSQGEVMVVRSGIHENLLVRISTRLTDQNKVEGYVVTFDDVTD